MGIFGSETLPKIPKPLISPLPASACATLFPVGCRACAGPAPGRLAQVEGGWGMGWEVI